MIFLVQPQVDEKATVVFLRGVGRCLICVTSRGYLVRRQDAEPRCTDFLSALSLACRPCWAKNDYSRDSRQALAGINAREIRPAQQFQWH